MSASRLLILIFTLLLSMGGCRSGDSPEVAVQSNLSGGAAKAASLARARFANFIAPERKYGELGLFLSDINNYKVVVDERSNSYSVTFLPENYHGRALKGGGGVYILSKNNFSIIHEEHFK